jgi:hypothetical protein
VVLALAMVTQIWLALAMASLAVCNGRGARLAWSRDSSLMLQLNIYVQATNKREGHLTLYGTVARLADSNANRAWRHAIDDE